MKTEKTEWLSGQAASTDGTQSVLSVFICVHLWFHSLLFHSDFFPVLSVTLWLEPQISRHGASGGVTGPCEWKASAVSVRTSSRPQRRKPPRKAVRLWP